MRHLRILCNALVAGLLAAACLTVLVLQLNPAFPLSPGPVAVLGAGLALVYAPVVAAVCWLALGARQVVAAEALYPAWVSVRVLSWLGTFVTGGAAAIMWLNLRGFGNVLDQETARRMAGGAIAMTAAAVLLLVLAVAPIGRRGRGVSAALLSLTLAGALGLPLLARGPARTAAPFARSSPAVAPAPGPDGVEAAVDTDAGPANTAGRVLLLVLDGASLDIISPAVAAGRLPGFGRILDRGAVVHLATLRPTQAEPVLSAVATGRLPIANGVRSALSYGIGGNPPDCVAGGPCGPVIDLLPDYCFAQMLSSLGILREGRHTPDSLTARPVWTIIGTHGADVGVIGWPLTHPAPTVHGFLVSDRFHRLTRAQMAVDGPAEIWPPRLLDTARAALALPVAPDPLSLVDLPSISPSGDREAALEPEPLLADRIHLQLYRTLTMTVRPRFTAVRFPGIDAVGHYYLRYANPTPFGDVTEEERQRYGRVLEEYYAFLDGIVGEVTASLGPDDLLLIVSPFGMEPLSPGKRLLEQVVGNPLISGTHERAPDGFLLAFGRAVAPGRPARASVLDVTPTILYYLGLPVGRDMDGFARADIFTPAFIAEHPITYIPTHER